MDRITTKAKTTGSCGGRIRAVCGLWAAGKDLLHEFNPRVYVAELPPKYNIDTVAQEGCKDVRALELLMSNPLGNLLSESLDAALYRHALQLAGVSIGPAICLFVG